MVSDRYHRPRGESVIYCEGHKREPLNERSIACVKSDRVYGIAVAISILREDKKPDAGAMMDCFVGFNLYNVVVL